MNNKILLGILLPSILSCTITQTGATSELRSAKDQAATAALVVAELRLRDHPFSPECPGQRARAASDGLVTALGFIVHRQLHGQMKSCSSSGSLHGQRDSRDCPITPNA